MSDKIDLNIIHRVDDERVASIIGVNPTALVPLMRSGDGGIDAWEYNTPHYTSDASADYRVLEWARESSHAYMFAKTLHLDMWDDDTWDAFIHHYKPGDYSRALLALKEKGIIK